MLALLTLDSDGIERHVAWNWGKSATDIRFVGEGPRDQQIAAASFVRGLDILWHL